MKRFITLLAVAATMGACCNNNDNNIVIDDQNHENIAYDKSYELATKVREAATYEEFVAASNELKAYEEAFRTQIGGESHLLFIEECNYILNED